MAAADRLQSCNRYAASHRVRFPTSCGIGAGNEGVYRGDLLGDVLSQLVVAASNDMLDVCFKGPTRATLGKL